MGNNIREHWAAFRGSRWSGSRGYKSARVAAETPSVAKLERETYVRKAEQLHGVATGDQLINRFVTPHWVLSAMLLTN